MPLVIAFMSGAHAKGQAIRDLSRDVFGDASFWTTTVVALGRFAERISGDAAELNGSNFDAAETDFDRMHFETPKKEKAAW